MPVRQEDKKTWLSDYLKFDPIENPPPKSCFAYEKAATSIKSRDLHQERIAFDSQSKAGIEHQKYSGSQSLDDFIPITWPKGLEPIAKEKIDAEPTDPLPKADVLIVVWTADETNATAMVLTPGRPPGQYIRYTRKYGDYVPNLVEDSSPALKQKTLGHYWVSTIDKKSVVVFKSELHPARDSKELPTADLFRQIISEVEPKLVITTGTAGAIGGEYLVGDVFISSVARFRCTAKLADQPFANATYTSRPAKVERYLGEALGLIKLNADKLPKCNTRLPNIFISSPDQLDQGVVTTDKFAIDTIEDAYHLQGLGTTCDMDDASLGLATSRMESPPDWISIRNVSDPQIKDFSDNVRKQKSIAAQIYKVYGKWSTISSAIACWAIIASQ